MKALTVRQPWAHAIIHLGKCVENRSRPTKYRGPLLIHSAQTYDPESWKALWAIQEKVGQKPLPLEMKSFDQWQEESAMAKRMGWAPIPRDWPAHGGIIGRVNLIGCYHIHGGLASHLRPDPWATGPWCWVLANPEPLPFAPCKGRLGLWNYDGPKLKEL